MSERRLDRKKMRYGLSVSIVERQCDTRKGEKRRQMKMITCPDDVIMRKVMRQASRCMMNDDTI